MRYVLDANVYILAFGGPPLPKIDEMLEVLVSHPDRFELVVGRTILSEIQRHLDTGAMHACWDLLKAIEAVPVEDWQIPYELVQVRGRFDRGPDGVRRGGISRDREPGFHGPVASAVPGSADRGVP